MSISLNNHEQRIKSLESYVNADMKVSGNFNSSYGYIIFPKVKFCIQGGLTKVGTHAHINLAIPLEMSSTAYNVQATCHASDQNGSGGSFCYAMVIDTKTIRLTIDYANGEKANHLYWLVVGNYK